MPLDVYTAAKDAAAGVAAMGRRRHTVSLRDRPRPAGSCPQGACGGQDGGAAGGPVGDSIRIRQRQDSHHNLQRGALPVYVHHVSGDAATHLRRRGDDPAQDRHHKEGKRPLPELDGGAQLFRAADVRGNLREARHPAVRGDPGHVRGPGLEPVHGAGSASHPGRLDGSRVMPTRGRTSRAAACPAAAPRGKSRKTPAPPARRAGSCTRGAVLVPAVPGLGKGGPFRCGMDVNGYLSWNTPLWKKIYVSIKYAY